MNADSVVDMQKVEETSPMKFADEFQNDGNADVDHVEDSNIMSNEHVSEELNLPFDEEPHISADDETNHGNSVICDEPSNLSLDEPLLPIDEPILPIDEPIEESKMHDESNICDNKSATSWCT